MINLGNFLTGNPIVVKFDVDPASEDFSFAIKIADDVVYSGTGVPVDSVATIEISDILRNYVQSYPIQPSDEYLVKADGFKIPFTVLFNSVPQFTGVAVYGGIPKFLYRRLSQMSTDIFQYKYLNRDACNYILTTRTFSKQLVIRESEITPLLFMYSGENIKFVSHSGKTLQIEANEIPEPDFYVINLPQILHDFFIQKNELTRYINVLTNDIYSFSIAITPAQKTEEKYILEFRNSLGDYERIELNGRAQSESAWEEESLYNTFDDTVYDFVENRFRTLSTEVLKCECGYKTQEELFFLRDLIASDDIRILGPDGAWAKVQVIADEYAVYKKMNEPTSIPLQIRFCEKEAYYLPNIFIADSAGDTEGGNGWLAKGFWNASGFVLSNSHWKSKPQNT